jgi:PEGA domain
MGKVKTVVLSGRPQPTTRLFAGDDKERPGTQFFQPFTADSSGTVVALAPVQASLTGEVPVRRPPHLVLLLLPLAGVLLPTSLQAQFRYPPIYPAYRYASESDLRFMVKPKDAAVYVDGYFAGKVEDFDGTFQRLHVAPGQHEIVVYLEGYRSLKQRLYLSPNATRKIEGELEKLGPGEAAEPVPQPPPDSERRDPRDEGYDRTPPRPGPTTRRAPAPPPRDIPERSQPAPASQFGSLSIRVQPSGATVFIDGERWAGPSGNDERLIVQVPEGRHRIEAERDGYERFVTEIDVRRMETAPVNISLARAR